MVPSNFRSNPWWSSWFPILHRIEICEDGHHPFAEANGRSAFHTFRHHFRQEVPGQAVLHRARGFHILLRQLAFINPGEHLRAVCWPNFADVSIWNFKNADFWNLENQVPHTYSYSHITIGNWFSKSHFWSSMLHLGGPCFSSNLQSFKIPLMKNWSSEVVQGKICGKPM